MEFHCLWLTTQSQYKSWRALLSQFPIRLTHQNYLSYAQTNSALNRKKVAFCIWSEEEFHNTPKYLQKLLVKKQKPSLLLVKENRFALNAFQLGFSHCIDEIQVDSLLLPSVLDMLTTYFKPKNKSLFLQKKLWFTDSSSADKIYFLPLEKTVLLKKGKNQQKVYSTSGNYVSIFPFEWLVIQCENHPDFYKLNAKLLLNIQHIQSLKKGNRDSFSLSFSTAEKIQLSNKEGLALRQFLNPIT